MPGGRVAAQADFFAPFDLNDASVVDGGFHSAEAQVCDGAQQFALGVATGGRFCMFWLRAHCSVRQ